MQVDLDKFGSNASLVYLMTVDNSGPQSVDEVLEGWRNLRLLFPGALLLDSSLEAFTAEAWKVRSKMQTVTSELGDTWIRGTASDPTKQRRYREVARQLAAAIEGGEVKVNDPEVQAAYAQLIKLPEHTYGSNDGRVAGLPWDNTYMDQHINDSNYQQTSAGWADQRAYIDRAVAALGTLPLRQAIEKGLAAGEPTPIVMNGLSPWELDPLTRSPKGSLVCGTSGFTLQFDETGAISSLQSADGRQWADANHTLARFRYRTHSEGEFNAYGDRYMLPGCRANETQGSLCGFGKQGLTTVAGGENEDWAPQLRRAWKDDSTNCRAVLQYSFDAKAQAKYGAPRIANTTVSLLQGAGTESGSTKRGDRSRLKIDVQYHKRQTRMAESLWLSFAPLVKSPRGWRFDKLGRSIDPFDVVVNGSRAMHAVWHGLTYHEPPLPSHATVPKANPPPVLEVVSLDAPVLAVDQPSPIVFLRGEQVVGESWHFCLFNNAWNVNYPVWEIDTHERFRFELLL